MARSSVPATSSRRASERAATVFCRLLAEQRAIVLKNERPVLAGSVDALHDLRVALRRIRCLAATFVKLDRKKLTDLDRQLAEVCDAVGLARDLDVWGDLFRRLLRTGGLQQITRAEQRRVFAALRQQRTVLVKEAVQSPQFRHLKQALRACRPGALAGVRPDTPPARVFAARRMLEVRAIVADRYRKVGNYSKEPAHDLRRAGRRLRYLVDFFAADLGRETMRAGRWITQAQAALGKVHDSDNALRLSRDLPSGDARAAVRCQLRKYRAKQLIKFKTAWRRYTNPRLQKAWLLRLEAHAAC